MIPASPGLFEAIQCLEQAAHLALSPRECEAWWLPYVDDFSELRIEVGIFYVYLVYVPVVVHSEG